MVGLIVTIAATGGFGTKAPPFLGTHVEPGDVIETRFWDVAVHSAEVVESKGEVVVAITATNKQLDTQHDLTPNTLALRLPSGVPLFASWCTSGRALVFAPLIPADAECFFRFESSGIDADDLPARGPFDAEVVVLDQKINDNMLEVPAPAAGEPAAWVELTVNVAVESDV